MSFSFILASSTNYGIMLAQSLIEAGFFCQGVITPTARISGRKKILTQTPTEIWATQKNLPIFFVQKKLDQDLIVQIPTTDFLLVVDFGYFIPTALTDHARYLAVNVHPSALPKYRGSSPGQAALLHQDKNSAVSFIQVIKEMDAGDLLAQIPFAVDRNWNKDQYYDFAFALAAKNLPEKLESFARGEIKLQPQVGTPSFAYKLTRQDGYIEDIYAQPQLTYRKFLAYQPWPGIWTFTSAKKQLKILACHLDQKQNLVVDLVQQEGQTAKKPQSN